MVVLDPGESYLVSVFNIPKPEMYHSNYDVSSPISVPGEFKPVSILLVDDVAVWTEKTHLS